MAAIAGNLADNALERASDDTDFCPFVKLVLAIWNDDKVARLVG